MAQLFWSTTANINNGNQNAPITGRQAVIIEPDNSTTDSGTNQIDGNVVTPQQLSDFIAAQGVDTSRRGGGSTDATRWTNINENVKSWQIGNFYIMFGPGVRLDLSGWNIDIYDNGDRRAGFQIGGTEGNTVLVNDTILAETDASWVDTTGRRGTQSAQGTLTAWEVCKAQIFLDRTNIRYIKNVSGATGSGATASLTLALNGEIILANRPSYLSAFGTQSSVTSLGVGFHPTAAAGSTFTNRAMTGATGWRTGTGATGSWSAASLIQDGTSTTGNAIALKFDSNNLTINEPRVIQQEGGTLEFYSEAQETGVSNGTKWRFNTSGAFAGTTLTIDEFNHGGGVFAVNTSATTFVNQGSGHLNQQVFATGRSTAGANATLVPDCRGDDLVWDAWDYGTRTIAPGSTTSANTGHWDSFKRRYFNISIPATITDADLGTDSLYRCFLQNGSETGLGGASRFELDQDIAILSNANFMPDGTFRYTPAALAQNFRAALNTKANVNRDANNGNRFYFEGTETNALRIPNSFYNDNSSGANRTVRFVGEVLHSYIQYPYIPLLTTEQVQDISFGVIEDIDSTFSESLLTPVYVTITNQATVSGYGLLSTVNETIDRAYYNYLEEVKLDVIADVITNSDLGASFYLNSATATSIVYSAGDVEFLQSVAGLVRLNGSAIEIQATSNYQGNITASNPTSVLENSATQHISWGEGNLDFNTIDSDNFTFDGTNLTGEVTGDATFNGATVNGNMAISGRFENSSVHNGTTFDSSSVVDESTINGVATIASTGSVTTSTINNNATIDGEIMGSTITGNATVSGDIIDTTVGGNVIVTGNMEGSDITGTGDISGTVLTSSIDGNAIVTGSTTTTVYGGTCNLLNGTLLTGNTFNGNVMNIPTTVTNQTFGSVELFPVAGVLGTWMTNVFNGTTILLNENIDVRNWVNTGAVTFTANQAQTVDLTSVQLASGDYLAANAQVTFVTVDPPVASTVRTITVPQDGRLYVENTDNDSLLLGNNNGQVVTAAGYSEDLLFDGTGDALLGTTNVRVYYTAGPGFAPVVYDTTVGELVIRIEARNSLLFANSQVVTIPATNEDQGRLTVSLAESQGLLDSQRYLLNALTTEGFFQLLYAVNQPLAIADVITNFIDSGAEGELSTDTDYITIASDNLSATDLIQRSLVNVTLIGGNALGVANFTGTGFPSVLITAPSNASTGLIQSIVRGETDRVIENQEDINVKINGTTLAVGAIPASGDLPNTA